MIGVLGVLGVLSEVDLHPVDLAVEPAGVRGVVGTDDAYRAARALAKGAKLPKSIGTMPATGGGHNRRGRVTGGIGQSAKQAGAARSRVKLIG